MQLIEYCTEYKKNQNQNQKQNDWMGTERF